MNDTAQAAETRLVIISDDFGLHPLIDEAIISLAEEGVVSATSVLISAPEFSEERFAQYLNTGASAGIHLALTETKPLTVGLDASFLVRNGDFRPHWKNLALRLAFSRVPREAVEAEWCAQVEQLQSFLSARHGRIVHADTHQNVHLLPQFSSLMKKVCEQYDINYVRTFYDELEYFRPMYSFIGAWGRRAYGQRKVLPTFGLYQSGALDQDGIERCILSAKKKYRQFALMVHPGKIVENPFAYSLNWQKEYSALKSNRFRDFCEEHRIRMSVIEELDPHL